MKTNKTNPRKKSRNLDEDKQDKPEEEVKEFR